MATIDLAFKVHERFHLYSLPDKFFIEPRDASGNIASPTYLEIDRNFNTMQLRKHADLPIPVTEVDLQQVYGIVGAIELVSGFHLIVVKKAELVGKLNDAEIYQVIETDIIPYKKATLHLSEKEAWFNRQFVEMLRLVFSNNGFYYSTSFDISHSLQWLGENDSPTFQQLPIIERASPRFVWNRRLASPFSALPEMGHYVVPLIHGFVGIRQCVVRGSVFKLVLISRRSIHRAGVRFHMRGTDREGNSANFVETEQIIEFDQGDKRRLLTSFIQLRGSIPLLWSQKPNLNWQPIPSLKPTDDQMLAYRNHMNLQKQHYGGKHVIVNLVNQKGREKRVGGELERVALQANLDFVHYVGFDFHRECHSLNWDRLSVLRDIVASDITNFGFFYAPVEGSVAERRYQVGFIRSNCMDCLDRTNVVQTMFARESLRHQLAFLNIIDASVSDMELFPDFMHIFKNLWADNGDECSRQYAGTGALKTDYTRVGKRTMTGAMNDLMNSLTRYFKNNFSDGYKQDAIDLFLGNYQVDPRHLPASFETSVLTPTTNGISIIGAVFSAAMMLLCILVSENVTATLFWMVVFAVCMFFIFLNGEEFVNKPKLKQD